MQSITEMSYSTDNTHNIIILQCMEHFYPQRITISIEQNPVYTIHDTFTDFFRVIFCLWNTIFYEMENQKRVDKLNWMKWIMVW